MIKTTDVGSVMVDAFIFASADTKRRNRLRILLLLYKFIKPYVSEPLLIANHNMQQCILYNAYILIYMSRRFIVGFSKIW